MHASPSQRDLSSDAICLSQIITASFVSVGIYVLLASMGFALLRYLPFGISVAIVGSHGCFLLVSRRLLHRGRTTASLLPMTTGIVVMSIGMALVFPSLLPAIVLLPILSIVSVLPFVGGRGLVLYCSVFAIVEIFVIVLGNTVSLFEPPSVKVSTGLTIVASTLIVAVIFVVLWQFHTRLGQMLAHTQAANASLGAAQTQLEE